MSCPSTSMALSVHSPVSGPMESRVWLRMPLTSNEPSLWTRPLSGSSIEIIIRAFGLNGGRLMQVFTVPGD